MPYGGATWRSQKRTFTRCCGWHRWRVAVLAGSFDSPNLVSHIAPGTYGVIDVALPDRFSVVPPKASPSLDAPR